MIPTTKDQIDKLQRDATMFRQFTKQINALYLQGFDSPELNDVEIYANQKLEELYGLIDHKIDVQYGNMG